MGIFFRFSAIKKRCSLAVVILFAINSVSWGAPLEIGQRDTLRPMSVGLGAVSDLKVDLQTPPKAAVKVGRPDEVGPKSASAGVLTFGDDIKFLKKHLGEDGVIVLADESGDGQVAVVRKYQGRVMTSTADGENGTSFGWLNRSLISSGITQKHINPYGGEDRFWMGPEGGQYAIFFPQDASSKFEFTDWQTPPVIDTQPFEVVPGSQRRDSVSFYRRAEVTNYSGTRFDVSINRTIRLLTLKDIQSQLGIDLPANVKAVAYESNNKLTNAGSQKWTKDTGLLSIWILGMFKPSPQTTVVIPFRQGPEETLGPEVNDAYFGEVPPDRLKTQNGAHFFRGDGQQRGKIGVSPKRAFPIIGSYDVSTQTLTLVQYTIVEGDADYVNSLWKIQDEPYAGDAVNSYNDGSPAPGVPPLGPFVELETSSAARELSPNESISHTHRTIHIQGPEAELDKITRQTLALSLDEIKNALPLAKSASAGSPIFQDYKGKRGLNWYVGMDSSTQSVKFCVIDIDAKKIIWTHKEEFDSPKYQRLFNAPGGVLPHPQADEQYHTDPLMIAAALDYGMAKLSHDFRRRGWVMSNIRGIAGAGQQHGITAWSKTRATEALKHINDNPFDGSMWLQLRELGAFSRPTASIWMDGAAKIKPKRADGTEGPSVVERINEAAGGPEATRRLTGSSATPRFSLDTITVFRDTNLSAYNETGTFSNIAAFNGALLTGRVRFPFDPGDALGTNAADARAKDWAKEHIQKVAPGLTEKLPPIKASTHIVGRISRYWVKKYGFSPNTRIVNWTGDNPSSLTGMGIVEEGEWAISLGTSYTIFGFIKAAGLDKALEVPIGHVFGEPTGEYMLLACVQNGAETLEKIRDKYITNQEALTRWYEKEGATPSPADIDKIKWDIFEDEVARAPVGNNGAIMLPQTKTEDVVYIPFAAGQKPFMRNVDENNRPMVLRAAIEGQAYLLKWIAERIGVNVKKIRLTAGGSKSKTMRRILSDMLDARIDVLKVTDSTPLGSALRAAKADLDRRGKVIEWKELCKGLTEVDMTEGVPTEAIPDNVAIYKRHFADFVDLLGKAMATGRQTTSATTTAKTSSAGSVIVRDLQRTQTFLQNTGIVFGLISLEKLNDLAARVFINEIITAQKRGALYVPEIALRGTEADIQRALDLIAEIREKNPDAIIAAGSVSDSENSRKALRAGVDIIITPGFVLGKEDIDEIRAAGCEAVLGIGSEQEARRAKAAGLKFAKAFPLRTKVDPNEPSIEKIKEALLEAFKGPLASELRQFLKFVEISRTEGDQEATYANICKFVSTRPTQPKVFKLVPWGMELVQIIKGVFPDAAVTATGGATDEDITTLRVQSGINIAKSITTLDEVKRIATMLTVESVEKAAAKASSAGIEQLRADILSAQDILLSETPSQLNDNYLAKTKAALQQIGTAFNLPSPADAHKAADLVDLNDMLRAQEVVIEDIEVVAAAARAESDGQIIFDPEIIENETQRATIIKELKSLRVDLEDALSRKGSGNIPEALTQVVLLEDITSGRVALAKNSVLISNQQKLQGVRLLKPSGITDKDSYLATPYLIALARGFLSIDKGNYTRLIGNLERLYLKLTKEPMPQTVKESLQDGSWNIVELIINILPDVTTIDQKYMERLHRQALLALIAA